MIDDSGHFQSRPHHHRNGRGGHGARGAVRRLPPRRHPAIDVVHTWAQLADLAIKIARDAPGWQARGIILGRWGPAAESNTVVIELQSPTAASAQALYDAYGRDWITVSPEPFMQKLFRPGQQLERRGRLGRRCAYRAAPSGSLRPRSACGG
jgi:hypothetical protein